MGKFFLGVALLLIDITLQAQNGSDVYDMIVVPDNAVVVEEQLYNNVAQMPIFPGGKDSLDVFLRDLYYPKTAYNRGMEGTVTVYFIIDKNGNVANVYALKSSGHSLLDSAATMYVMNMPIWTPGVHNGKAVSVEQTVSFKFSMETYNTFSIVEEMPQFPGGRSAYDVFIASAPAPAGYTKKDLKDKAAFVEVIINKQGKVVLPLLVRSSGIKELDQIALKYVANSPVWKPGYQRGKAEQITYTLRITFVEGK